MRYVVLAAGFDGTLARDGRCDERSIEALRSLAASGRKLVLVTSRELRDLLDVFPQARLFDYLVAENGAVVHCPAARESAILAQAPSESLIHELKLRRIVPLCVGSSVVTTGREHTRVVAEVIAKLKLDYQLLENDCSVTVLPAGVSKATGVSAVLEELGLSPHNLVAIGDAENDLDLFVLAEHSVAVANAAPSLKSAADRVTRASYSAGFVEFAQELLETDLAQAPVRRNIVLGTRAGPHEVAIAPCQGAMLMSGPVASGKAALCNYLLGQYFAQRYQCCVIGAYPARRAPDQPCLASFGDPQSAPRVTDIIQALEQPAQSAFVNVAALAASSRASFLERLLGELAGLQSRTGRPHCVLIDQTEAIMTSGALELAMRLDGPARVYVTAQPSQLPRELLESIQVVLALGEASATLSTYRQIDPAAVPQAEHVVLEPEQALFWVRDSGVEPARIHIDLRAPRPNILPAERSFAAAVARVRSQRSNNDAALAP